MSDTKVTATAWMFTFRDEDAGVTGKDVAEITYDGRWCVDWPEIQKIADRDMDAAKSALRGQEVGFIAFARLLLQAQRWVPEVSREEADKIAAEYGAKLAALPPARAEGGE